MHRLSKLSASILGKKSDSEGPTASNSPTTPISNNGNKTEFNADAVVSFGSLVFNTPKTSAGARRNSSYQRPTSLIIPDVSDGIVTDKKTDDEWFETAALSPVSNRNGNLITDNSPAWDKLKNSDQDSGLSPILRSESAAEIEVMEQSLISLLDEFRSGQMKACKAFVLVLKTMHIINCLWTYYDIYECLKPKEDISEDRLEKMRSARKEMEELSSAHLKLHRMQTSQASMSSTINNGYDELFRKLDTFYESV